LKKELAECGILCMFLGDYCILLCLDLNLTLALSLFHLVVRIQKCEYADSYCEGTGHCTNPLSHKASSNERPLLAAPHCPIR